MATILTPKGHKVKSETLARLAEKHKSARMQRTADMQRQLAGKIERDGPDSIWVSLLQESIERNGDLR